jgi:SAM-dependent methyltransferase
LSRSAQNFAEQLKQLDESFRTGMEQAVQKQQHLRTELTLQGQRVSLLLEGARGALASFDKEQLQVMASEDAHALDAFYAALEDRFRGSTEEIKRRLSIYLPLIKKATLETASAPILDLGCGRGEWLALLKDEGHKARGVDLNRTLLAECREHGLEVIEADAVEALRRLPDATLSAVTGFHIAEHLPIETLMKMLDETVRVIKPGGVAIFETPNPQNVLVGSCNFYFDPTHRNPLPSPIMQFLLESRGFQHVQIMRLNPSDAEPVAGDTDLVKRFNQLFYGPMDYAVVGWKPDDGR